MHLRHSQTAVALASLATLLLAANLSAQEQVLKVDPASSEVRFTFADPLHAVHGTFRVQSGTVTFSPRHERMMGTVTVDAASGNSGNGTRDRKMRDDELKAPTYSTVTFAPQRYRGALAATGDSTITVDGVFTLLGTPHNITIPMQVHLQDGQCKATGSFAVPYLQWGLKDPSTFLLHVGKEVTVNLVLTGPVTAGHAESQ